MQYDYEWRIGEAVEEMGRSVYSGTVSASSWKN
jgi:hypothetical protein